MKRLCSALGILLLILMTGLAGCQTLKAAKFRYQSPILAGGQHTFAAYNDQHRLISDPLSELYAETKGKDITDVYVISHGWNFTLDEAYANYHNYMELLDRHLKEIQDEKKDPTFLPYFIYVVWPSVVRPLGDIAHAFLPFGLDTAIAPITNLIDSAIFHIPSGWKESLNAFSVALGTQYPSVLEEGLRDLGPKPLDIEGEGQGPVGDRDPAPPYCGPEEQRKPERRANASETLRISYDSYGVDSDGLMGRECPLSTLVYHILRWRTAEHARAKIHLVGHSYGAKVVTLAGMEAIRLQRAIAQTEGVTEEDPLPSEQSITSLVLFNPAFHPRELRYLVDGFRLNSFKLNLVYSDEVELLQNIHRKAILYSSRDYATGRLFDVSQLVFSNDLAQWGQTFTISTDTIRSSLMKDSYIPDFVGTVVITGDRIYSGSLTLTSGVAFGVLTWSATKLANLFPDWISHSRQGDFYGFDWSKGDSSTKVLTRGLLNAIDYWMPIGRVVTNADADKMGILRTAIPALGSIGMDRLVAGRWVLPTWVHVKELIGDDTDRRPGSRTDHDFCEVAGSLVPLNEVFDPRHFYSYDATPVMDTQWSFSGSHGDVRSMNPPKDCHCAKEDASNQPLEKRRYMFNFIYNFTRDPPAVSQAGTSE